MVELRKTANQRVLRLLSMFRAAFNNNPSSKPAMAVPPTVAIATSADAGSGLATAFAMISSNALTAKALNNVAWLGGEPTPASGYVAMPVSSAAPGNGNLAGFANVYGVTADMNQWNAAAEFWTDSNIVEVCLYTHPNKTQMFQVDGEYVSKSGHVAASAGNADNFFKLTFADRRPRLIRVMHANNQNASGTASFVKSIRIMPTCDIWKPDMSAILRAAFLMDSYGEGFPYALSVPNENWINVASELLGIRDPRQTCVGGTGYVSTGSGRSKARDQMPFWMLDQAPFDLLVMGHGFNDAIYTAEDVSPQVLSCLDYARKSDSTLPMVVLGSQQGRRGAADAGTQVVEAAIKAAVEQFNDPFVKFQPVSADPQPWLTGTGYVGATNASGNSDVYVGADGIHPSSPAGMRHLGTRLASAVHAGVQAMAA